MSQTVTNESIQIESSGTIEVTNIKPMVESKSVSPEITNIGIMMEYDFFALTNLTLMVEYVISDDRRMLPLLGVG